MGIFGILLAFIFIIFIVVFFFYVKTRLDLYFYRRRNQETLKKANLTNVS